MNRLPLVGSDSPDEHARALLARTQATLGKTPNLYRAMANAPAALEGYLSFRDALGRGALEPRLKEQIALLVAEENACGYCVSAHAFRGARLGLSAEELEQTRSAHSSEPRVEAALRFVQAVGRARGLVTDSELARVRAAGWSDGELSEMVAHVALNVFSNYFNHLAQPELDFPQVTLGERG